MGLAIVKGHVCIFLEGNIPNKFETRIAFTLVHEADPEGLRIYNTSCRSTRVRFAVCRVGAWKAHDTCDCPTDEKIGCMLHTRVS